MKQSAACRPALLLIGCSRRKRTGRKRGRAWDVYDGQLLRILKKALAGRPAWQDSLRILIVSARHGVIDPDRMITTGEECLTLQKARHRGTFWAEGLYRAVRGRRFREVHSNLGKDDQAVLPPLEEVFPDCPLSRATGGIGTRNAQTRAWVTQQLAGGED